MTILTIAIGAAFLLNILATIVVLRSSSYAVTRKTAQVLIVWFVPVLGAAACIIFARADMAQVHAIRSPEFYDNADASGSDH